MATRVCDWLAVAVCESESAVPQTLSRKRPPGPRPLRSLRLRHPTRCHLPRSPTTAPLHPSPAPACQRARPRSPGQPRYGRCGSCRFTRPIWPPVPRSGVAPLRSPQSLPYLRPHVKGWVSIIAHCIPSEATRQGTVSGLPRDAPHRIHQLREPHQFTTSSLLCQVGRHGARRATRLARRRWVRASKTIIVR
jgi:hypothetical protein